MSFIGLLWGLHSKALYSVTHTVWNGADLQWILFLCWKIVSSTLEIWSQILIFFLFCFYHWLIFNTDPHFPPVIIHMEPKKCLSLFLAFWETYMSDICIPFLFRFLPCIFLLKTFYDIFSSQEWVYFCACVCILGERLSIFPSIF